MSSIHILFKSLLLLIFIIITTISQVQMGSALAQAKRETERLLNIEINYNSTYIMFWRPQKVGSSTIVMLLLSYFYRNNIIQKRRGFSNSLCVKMLKCISQSKQHTTTDIVRTNVYIKNEQM